MSTRPWRIRVCTRSPLPRTQRSLPGFAFKSATDSAASPVSSVEFSHGSSAASVRDATYFCVWFSTSVNGLGSVCLGQ